MTIPDIGPWGKRKYHFLGRYLDIFTTAMRKKWPQIHYIDLFAGAGLARIRGTSEIVPTSAMIAATLRYPFTGLHLCDADPGNCEVLKARLASQAERAMPQIECGDANTLIDSLLARIPQSGALCVTFADPFGLHLDFDTVRKVASRNSDLIILLADNMDALRNWATYYYNNPRSSLDRFMGEQGWRKLLEETPSDRQATALRDRYQERLRSLGYSHFDREIFQNSKGSDIYSLHYASRHPLGLAFWRKASEVDEGGQRTLQFNG